MSVLSPALIRNDLDVPVMVVRPGRRHQREPRARQPDTAISAKWELAGTSHADSYTTSVGFGDIGDGRRHADARFMQHPQELGCSRPINGRPPMILRGVCP
jgi:hypothetical protein